MSWKRKSVRLVRSHALLKAFFGSPIRAPIDYNLLFRWFVGLPLDTPAWHATLFTHNRGRLLEADVAGL